MRRLLLGLIAPFWLSTACAAPAWPDLLAPAHGAAEPLGDTVRLNGLPMRVVRYRSARSFAALQAHYRHVFGARRVEHWLAGDWVVAQLDAQGRLSTVRLHAESRETLATIAIADLTDRRRHENAPFAFPVPAGSRVLSDLQSWDGGRESRQWLVANRHALSANEAFFRRTLAEKGWVLVRQEHSPQHRTLWMQSRGRDATLVLSREGGQSLAAFTSVTTP